MGELGREWCRGRARRAAPAEPGRGRLRRRPPCGPRPAACRGWGEAGRSPDGRDARRSGRKSADAARRAAGLRPRFLRPAGAQKAPGGAGGRGDHSPFSPMNSRMREPCGMSSVPMGKKWR